VLNRPGALLAVHDKLATALRLATRGLPHPRTGARRHGLACRPRIPGGREAALR
jgi:glutathione synthase/RimK-type ligase-like ATP-grasp enzyme